MSSTMPGGERQPARRLLANAGAIFSGSIVGALVNFLALALTGHLLAPAAFGLLVLVSSYAQIVSRLLSFQSWQALIRYGAQARANPEEFSRLVSAGLLLDGGAAIVSTVLFLASIHFFAAFYHLTPDANRLAYGFGITLLTNLAGMPVGVLRLLDRFRWLGLQEFATASIRLALLLVLGLCMRDFTIFTIGVVWIVSLTAGQLLLFYLGLHALRAQAIGLCSPLRAWRFLRENPHVFSFFVVSNADATVRVVRDADVLIVGAVLTPAAAGFFRLAKQIAALAARPADAMYAALFPEFVALVNAAAWRRMIRLMARFSSLAVLLGLLATLAFLALGPSLLAIAFGPSYVAAFAICLMAFISNLVWVAGHPLAPAMLALDLQRQGLAIHVTITAAYLVTLALVAPQLGLWGAGLALIGGIVLWVLMSAIAVANGLWRRARHNPD